MKSCSHRACDRIANHGLGWGRRGPIQWFCSRHFTVALERLAGLVAS